MVERAKAQYPELAFQVCDALSLPFEGEFDVVFSNAVFHWIADHDTLLEKCAEGPEARRAAHLRVRRGREHCGGGAGLQPRL